jgi:hypothetical protein
VRALQRMPHLAQQLGLAERAGRLGCQPREQVELDLRKLDARVANPGVAPAGVDLQATDPDPPAATRRLRAAQQRLDPRYQQRVADRLTNCAIRARRSAGPDSKVLRRCAGEPL